MGLPACLWLKPYIPTSKHGPNPLLAVHAVCPLISKDGIDREINAVVSGRSEATLLNPGNLWGNIWGRGYTGKPEDWGGVSRVFSGIRCES